MVPLSYYRCGIRHARAYLARAFICCFNTCVDVIKHPLQGELDSLELGLREELERCARTGEQVEVPVDRETVEELVRELGYDAVAVGGQAGQMALTASRLGVRCYLHSEPSSRLRELFRGLEVLVGDAGGLVRVDELEGDAELPVHYVIELRAGDVHFGFRVPSHTRFIASHDSAAFTLKLNPSYLEHLTAELRHIPKACVSGFHLVEGRHASRLREAARLIEEWREDLYIHTELGQFSSSRTLEMFRRHVLPLVDSAGFNEVELRQLTGEEELGGALAAAAQEVERAVFHTSQYALCLASPQDHPKQLRAALQFGTLLASYRAVHGVPPDMRGLEGFSTPKPDSAALQVYRRLRRQLGERLCFVPALTTPAPRHTVGLGDTFAAGFVLVV
ncbi:MAG: hypothetical protein GXN98_01155 [Euryarchaeota archaeon]|nr:hypothetical protein [Euryarchaeota archaeon]